MTYLSSKKNTNGGYVILMSILVLGAIGLAVTITLLLSGLALSRTSLIIEQSNRAQALANMCTEEALQKIRDTTEFVGNGDLTQGNDTCVFLVTGQELEARTIEATGFTGEITRRVKVIIDQINPAIHVVSWQDVANF